MSTEEGAPEAALPPVGWMSKEEKDEQSFFGRLKKAFAAEPDAPPEAPPAEEERSRPVPRKAKRTAFDRPAKTSRRTRLRRAAEQKREGLALVVGDRVEKVIVEKIQPQEEAVARVAEGMRGLSEGLGPLREIAEGVEKQGDAQERVAQAVSEVPDLVALVRHGSGSFEGQLATLRDVRSELELHRAQRERVLEGVARVETALGETADRFERALAALGDQLEQARAEDRRGKIEERVRLEQRLEGVVRDGERRAADDAERFERSLAVVAARVHEQSSAIIESQEAAAQSARRAERAILDGFEDAQARAIERMEKLNEEWARAQARAARRTTLAAIVTSVLVLAAGGAAGWRILELERERTSAEVAGERARAEAALEVARSRTLPAVAPVGSTATTLPAGMKRE